MNTTSTEQRSVISGQVSVVRPFYWSVWRELWENRSIYIAPLIVGGVVVFGWMLSAGHLPERRRNAMMLDAAARRMAIELPYDVAALMIMITAFIVGLFYCLDALHGERRERSILFWKSLPVSDLTTVLSKMTVPMVVLPLVSFVVVVATQFLMMLVSSAALLTSGLASTTWANFNLPLQSVILLYGLVATALWHAPIYGWALLVSGWARRATFLWAVLPPLAIGFFEKITFGTSHFFALMKERFFGFAPNAFDFAQLVAAHTAHEGQKAPTIDSLAKLTPGTYLSTPGLWLGLAVAAGFLIVAVRMRRYRGPL